MRDTTPPPAQAPTATESPPDWSSDRDTVAQDLEQRELAMELRNYVRANGGAVFASALGRFPRWQEIKAQGTLLAFCRAHPHLLLFDHAGGPDKVRAVAAENAPEVQQFGCHVRTGGPESLPAPHFSEEPQEGRTAVRVERRQDPRATLCSKPFDEVRPRRARARPGRTA
mmetsp:Transcript_141704/g.317396  ORF Transcript_141704/g.317396 Transcript_141704/m.317396 type:complete len:170 (+) Transcript_141704:952-1461(+)